MAFLRHLPHRYFFRKMYAPVCGYNGVIGEVCPKCGRHESDELIKFERIRRITGYLVGSLDRFNNAKAAEERERVKHGL